MKIKLTISQIINYNAVAQSYINRHPEQENKVIASIKSMSRQVQKVFDKYNEEREEIRLSNCAVNPADQTILREPSTVNAQGVSVPGDYKFTIEGHKKVTMQIKELLATEVELDSRIADGIDELISLMSPQEREMFSGLVIPPQAVMDVVEE